VFTDNTDLEHFLTEDATQLSEVVVRAKKNYR
jgi:hypothetical protein